MLTTKPFTHKHQFSLILVLGLLLLFSAVQCGSAPQETVVGVETEEMLEAKVIATEKIPLNNCGGNSVLGIDVERSREFVYAIINKDGYSFGPEYGFLKAFLEKEYSVIDGEKETQTHTIHLVTQANTHVIYTIAWKETWLNGRALVISNGKPGNQPYKVKKGLTLEIQEAENVNCESASIGFNHAPPDEVLCETTTEGWSCDLTKSENIDGSGTIEDLDRKFEQTCNEQGGQWKCYGFCGANYPRYCDFAFEDAGKSCTDSSQCNGLCVAEFNTKCEKDCMGKCSEYALRLCDWYNEVVNSQIKSNMIICD